MGEATALGLDAVRADVSKSGVGLVGADNLFDAEKPCGISCEISHKNICHVKK